MDELRERLAAWLWDNCLKSDADRGQGSNLYYADKVLALIGQEHLAAIEAAREEGRAAGRRWISVGKRLPREGLTVLCLQENGKPKLCSRAHGAWEEDSGFYLGHVTHWMPLPPAPERGEHGEEVENEDHPQY